MTSELFDSAARRLTIAMIAANAGGALVVFLFATVVLPQPAHLHPKRLAGSCAMS
jgi:hypothetical protein